MFCSVNTMQGQLREAKGTGGGRVRGVGWGDLAELMKRVRGSDTVLSPSASSPTTSTSSCGFSVVLSFASWLVILLKSHIIGSYRVTPVIRQRSLAPAGPLTQGTYIHREKGGILTGVRGKNAPEISYIYPEIGIRGSKMKASIQYNLLCSLPADFQNYHINEAVCFLFHKGLD